MARSPAIARIRRWLEHDAAFCADHGALRNGERLARAADEGSGLSARFALFGRFLERFGLLGGFFESFLERFGLLDGFFESLFDDRGFLGEFALLRIVRVGEDRGGQRQRERQREQEREQLPGFFHKNASLFQRAFMLLPPRA